ncbi:unnamed protein product [Prunus armeniaca]
MVADVHFLGSTCTTQMESENTQQVNGKGKSKQDYNARSVEVSRMLLQLMVDAASRGWRDANGV